MEDIPLIDLLDLNQTIGLHFNFKFLEAFCPFAYCQHILMDTDSS